MIYVIADTNLFIECHPLAQLKWSELYGAEPVMLVVPMTVIRELDDLKSNGKTQGKRDRALKALQLCRSAKSGSVVITTNVSLMVRKTEPQEATFVSHSLDPKIADDRIIASAMEVWSEHLSERMTTLSGDTTFDIKCSHNEMVPDSWKIAEPIANQQILTATVPKLELLFDNGTPLGELNLTEASAANLPSVDQIMEMVKKKLPALNPVSMPVVSMSGIDVRPYNRKLFQFHEDYEKWLNGIINWHKSNADIAMVKLLIKNSGGGPASHVRAELKFPDDLKIVTSGRDEAPVEPQPPNIPALDDFFPAYIHPSRTLSFRGPIALCGNGMLASDSIEVKGQSVIVKRGRLQHEDTYSVQSIPLEIGKGLSQGGFQISATIVCDELLAKKLTLNVKFNKQQGSGEHPSIQILKQWTELSIK
jgi:hypothetical protein